MKKLIGIIGGLALATMTLLAAPASANDRGNDSGWRGETRQRSQYSYNRRSDRSYSHDRGWYGRRTYRDSSYRDSRYDSRYDGRRYGRGGRDDCNYRGEY
jgi:hypothetical protein